MGHGLQITFDAADPPRLARFWSLALGYVEQPPPPGFDSWQAFAAAQGMRPEAVEDYGAIVDPAGVGPRVFFQKVPEAKTAKNPVHLDVRAPAGGSDDHRNGIEAHVARLIGAGAVRLADHDEADQFWVVLQDPEGNEFCVT